MLFIIFILINLCYAQNYFITSNKNATRFFCATNNSYALTWIDDSITETAESRYPSVNNKTNFDCDFNSDCKSDWIKNSWKFEESSLKNNIPEIIKDRRWEKFKLYKTATKIDTSLSIQTNESITYVPISIRIKDEVEIWFCDSCQILNCIGFTFFKDFVLFNEKENRSLQSTKEEFLAKLTDKYWKHFLIQIENKQLSPPKIKITSDNNHTIQHHFFKVSNTIKLSNIIFKKTENTKDEGFLKIHDYSYISQNKSTDYVSLGKPIKVINGSVCISMFIRNCENCTFRLILHDGTTLLNNTIRVIRNQQTWKEIIMNFDNIKTNDIVNLQIATEFTNTNNSFFNIADIKLCNKYSIRRIFTKGNKVCQLLSEENTIKMEIAAKLIPRTNCRTDAIGPLCIPCNYFYPQSCDSIKTCYKVYNNEIACSCSAGFYEQECAFQCSSGLYGHGCQQKCSNCSTCSNIHGTCHTPSHTPMKIPTTDLYMKDIDTNHNQEKKQSFPRTYEIYIITMSVIIPMILIIIGYLWYTRCYFKTSTNHTQLISETYSSTPNNLNSIQSERIQMNTLNCNNVNVPEPLYAEIDENSGNNCIVINEIYTPQLK